MNPEPRLFAVVPAAGHSRRMGVPKLLLPLGDKTVIGRLLDCLQASIVAETVVVVRQDDVELAAAVSGPHVTTVQPAVAPECMRESVMYAVAEIRKKFQPSPRDGWLLIPADHPLLDIDVLNQVCRQWLKTSPTIFVPEHNGRGGHPTIFRWELTDELPDIPADCGLNWLVERHAADVVRWNVDHPAILTDLDTPADYERLTREWQEKT